MISNIDTDKALFQTLQTYLCTNVWNQPLSECRRNITLRALSKGRSAISSFGLGCTTIPLPYSNSANVSDRRSFFIYAAAKCCMGGIIVDTEQSDLKTKLKNDYNAGWLPLDKYLNVRPFDLRIHGLHGEWIYRNQVFIRNHPYLDMFLIAVETKMAYQILGKDYDFFNMLMSVYYDSDNNFDINDPSSLEEGSPKISCFHPTNNDVTELNASYNAYNQLSEERKRKTMFFIDGREAVPTSLTDIKYGQYIELVYDPDIICDIVLDLTDPNSSNMYRSPIDDTYKYIVHIPKQINPENRIITHNTCDIFIRPINPKVIDHARLKGLFVHRFDTSQRDDTGMLADHVITQITHNDFGISEKLIQPYMKFIGSSECALRIVVRTHNKPAILQDDANFLKTLYQFSDETILSFLTNNNESNIDFWNAAYLEEQPFSKMLMDVPSEITESNISSYIKTLGYYNTLSIIAPRVKHHVVEKTNTRNFRVEIPISMLTCDNIGLMVYLNGLKVDNNYVSYNRAYQYLEVTLDNSIAFNENDDITFELFDGRPFKAGEITVSSIQTDNNGIIIPHQNEFVVDEDFNVYRVLSITEEDSIPNEYLTNNYPHNCDKSYYKLTEDEINQIVNVVDNKNGTYTLTFSEEMAGRTYLITSKRVYQRFSNTDIINAGGCVNISGSGDKILNTGKLMIRAVSWDKPIIDEETGIANRREFELPIIDHELVSIAFLNRKELARNIDFTYKQIFSERGGVLYSTIFFNNISYLDNTENNVEVVISSDHEFMNYHGFMRVFYEQTSTNTTFLYGVVEESNPFVFWFEKLCTFAIDGYTRADVKKSDGYLKVYKNSRNSDNRYPTRQGGLYYTRGLVPIEVIQFVNRYWNNSEDIRKMQLICEYLKENAVALPDTRIVLQKSHHIASITMAALVHDVLNGTKHLAYEIDALQMRKQLEEYISLKKYDAAMTGISSELIISGAGVAQVNNVYTMTDTAATGLNRKWENNSSRIKVWWNCDRRTKRWEIANTIATNQVVYYYANDPDGSHDPWTLKWKSAASENSPIPIIESGALDLRYIDLFPSYSSDLHVVADDRTLRQAMIALFPSDTIRDGDTTT